MSVYSREMTVGTKTGNTPQHYYYPIPDPDVDPPVPPVQHTVEMPEIPDGFKIDECWYVVTRNFNEIGKFSVLEARPHPDRDREIELTGLMYPHKNISMTIRMYAQVSKK